MSDTTELTKGTFDAAIMENLLIGGDLEKLTPKQRVDYYKATCESLGLNPLTKPFGYIKLNGRLTLYAMKDATDQLRASRHISITNLDKQFAEDLYIVTAYATTPDGRTDAATGAVTIGGLKGDARANALMKAETKAKRRVTLSICGLGFSDENEVATIPGAQQVVVTESGEISNQPVEPPMTYEQAAAMEAKGKDGNKRLDSLNASQLQYIVEHSDNEKLIQAAFVVLDHDHNMPRPEAQ